MKLFTLKLSYIGYSAEIQTSHFAHYSIPFYCTNNVSMVFTLKTPSTALQILDDALSEKNIWPKKIVVWDVGHFSHIYAGWQTNLIKFIYYSIEYIVKFVEQLESILPCQVRNTSINKSKQTTRSEKAGKTKGDILSYYLFVQNLDFSYFCHSLIL